MVVSEVVFTYDVRAFVRAVPINEVVAIWVVLSPAVAFGAVGVPVNDGLAKGAHNAILESISPTTVDILPDATVFPDASIDNTVSPPVLLGASGPANIKLV